jgi:hypothetical protein
MRILAIDREKYFTTERAEVTEERERFNAKARRRKGKGAKGARCDLRSPMPCPYTEKVSCVKWERMG